MRNQYLNQYYLYIKGYADINKMIYLSYLYLYFIIFLLYAIIKPESKMARELAKVNKIRKVG